MRRFLEGPAGTGKTTYTIEHLRTLLEEGVPSDSILVLVPHRALGQRYQSAFASPGWPNGAEINVATMGGLARRGLETFWPLIAEKAGFDLLPEPTFLTIETSQYFMAGFVLDAIRTGVFDSVSMRPFQIMRQILDNLSKAAVNGFEPDEVAARLTAAWGGRHSSRPPVYHASQSVAEEFRTLCTERHLLDFSLQMELFMQHLLQEDQYKVYFQGRYRHLVVDNLEENYPITADFLDWWWEGLESALLVYDQGGGFRVFLGADPDGMHDLAARCDETEKRAEPVQATPGMEALATAFHGLLEEESLLPDGDFGSAFTLATHRFFPQMIDWVAEQITALVADGTSPREIVVLAPFLGDSLRFALTSRLAEQNIPAVSHRPSRAVRDEPAARAVLTLMILAYPEWEWRVPVMDVAGALSQVIPELDPVRAWLLAHIVYRPGRHNLGQFEDIEARAQARITFRAGNKYDYLRGWLLDYADDAPGTPPDHFISRLFGEVLSQPDFGFHANFEAGRVIGALVESARKFRQALHPNEVEDWRAVTHDYVELVQEGLLAALNVASWHDEDKDAVFLAPAHTFLMRDRWVDHQFWVDVGSNQWWERLEQPLTHPYVLRRDYDGQVWTDEREFAHRQEALQRLLTGLVRRCRQHVYFAISDLGEQGFEQRGPVLNLLQQLLQAREEA